MFVAMLALPSEWRLPPRTVRHVVSFLGPQKLPCLLLKPEKFLRNPGVALRHKDSSTLLVALESLYPNPNPRTAADRRLEAGEAGGSVSSWWTPHRMPLRRGP